MCMAAFMCLHPGHVHATINACVVRPCMSAVRGNQPLHACTYTFPVVHVFDSC